jgi:hypothetical protein
LLKRKTGGMVNGRMINFIVQNKKQMKLSMQNPLLFALVLITGLLFSGCDESPAKPDVSQIKVKLKMQRFEKDFFALDTNNLDRGFEKLRVDYHNFLNDYTGKILGLEGKDTSQWNLAIKTFLRDYRPIYDSAQKIDKGIIAAKLEIEEGLKYVKHYFPSYKLPEEFITFIGPIDAFAYGQTGGSGDIITTFGLCAGLQLHLGENSMVYKSEAGMQLYPEYISRKFNTENIAVNCMKNIIDDIHAPLQAGGSMLAILADHGKRMYLLDLLLPDAKEEIKLGYTTIQLEAVKKSEGFIWNYFNENNLLFEKDLLKMRSFVTDGPSTNEFGLGSPGFISLYTGRQLIRAYMKKHPATSLNELLALDANKILSGAGYKPR